MKAAFPMIMEMAGFANTQQSDYKIESIEIKDLNVRIDGLAVPLKDDLPLVAIEYYAYADPRAYRNLFYKIFRYIESHKWNGKFLLILIFANQKLDNRDKVLEVWANTPPFVRIHLDEWLKRQEENPFTDLLRLIIEDENPVADFHRIENAKMKSLQDPFYETIFELFQNAYHKKYNISLENLIAMLNLNEPFDYRTSLLYLTMEKKAQENAQKNIENKLRFYEDEIRQYESEISHYESEISHYESEISHYESEISHYEEEKRQYESEKRKSALSLFQVHRFSPEMIAQTLNVSEAQVLEWIKNDPTAKA